MLPAHCIIHCDRVVQTVSLLPRIQVSQQVVNYPQFRSIAGSGSLEQDLLAVRMDSQKMEISHSDPQGLGLASRDRNLPQRYKTSTVGYGYTPVNNGP